MNKKKREEYFEIGQKVWLECRNLRLPSELAAKWTARCIGPFAIPKIIPKGVYVLDIERRFGRNWHPIFHVPVLKKYLTDDKQLHLWQHDSRPDLEYENRHNKLEKSQQC